MREQELIVYRNFEDGALLYDMAWIMEHYGDPEAKRRRAAEPGGSPAADGSPAAEYSPAALFYDCIHRLIELAGTYGFHGNLWHCYLADLLVNNENSYSCGCEIRGEIRGTINDAALHDIAIFKEFYDYDFSRMCECLHVPEYALTEHYEIGSRESRVYNTRICARICELAEKFRTDRTPEEMKATLTEFYREYGVGKFGLHKSFRVVHDQAGVHVEPIPNIAHVALNDLVGYDIPKKKLTDNTDAFVAGRKANNCLLFGDAGTGKSSCIKAIANEYYEKGLRIIEIYRHQFQDLNQVIGQIKKRNYKFIIYMDDLSFEDFETEYKYLKAVIEGGLEKKPDNVLIYATSNRRHLIRENYGDREEIRQDMHTGDTVQEKLSLVYRFGVTIYFGAPDKRQFQDIVKALAQREGLKLSEEELLAEANKWELSHGGLSGRTARQFVDYLLGART
ncbi:MAG: ATP-binding protein [Butyrivibrio sp.]|nr:ATP-binding protein [Acetatifactor muris]MCM1559979.1 ATP-binding protein [Butyrivibrio sp.]